MLLSLSASSQEKGFTLESTSPIFKTDELNYDSSTVRELLEAAASLEVEKADSALLKTREALIKSKKIGYSAGVIQSLLLMAKIEMNNGQYDNSYFHLQEAFQLCIDSDPPSDKIITALDLMSTVYQMQGNYDAAAVNLYKAIDFAKDFGVSSARIARLYNNIAALLLRMDQLSDGLFYLEKASRIGINENDLPLQVSSLLNKGIIYAMQKDWKKSEANLLSALSLAKKHGMAEYHHNILLNLGSGYLDRNMPQKALDYLLEAVAIKVNIPPYYQNGALIEIGRAYFLIKDYEKARYYLEEGLQRGLEASLNNDVKEAHKYLSMVYDNAGAYKKALEHHKGYVHYKNLIEGENIRKNISILEKKYQSVRKDNELVHKQLLISQQNKKLAAKDFWIAGITSGTLLLSLLFIGTYRNYRQKQALQTNRIRLLQQEQQIGQLKAMMKGEEKERTRIARELHDGIGGMLTAIKMNMGSAQKQFPEVAELPIIKDIMYMLQDTSSEVRKTAHNLMPDVLMRLGLEDALVIYCSHLCKDNLQIDVQFQGNLMNIGKPIELILYRIVQELIQNVVKHANASYAAVQIMQHHNLLTIMVEDNGCGFNAQQESAGFGLQNLQYRIQALEGTLSIDSAEGRDTTIYIAFDLLKLKNSVAV